MDVALVHDWLTGFGGGENVLQAISELYSGDIYTLVHNEKNMQNTYFANKTVHTSFIQRIPFSKRKYQNFLPLFPLAIEQFDLSKHDVILSSSHCVAKGVLTQPHQLHICYCHTPIRYAWDLYHQYLNESRLKKGIKGVFAKLILHYLRMWDYSSSFRVDAFIANSRFVAKRIKNIYHRDSHVIYPGVDTDFYSLEKSKEKFFLTASRMVPYKKLDLIVEAFANMPDKELLVIGDGPERKKIEKKAKKNIKILGYVDDAKLKQLMQKAKAFVFAAIEDFGIIPLEAQSAGTPVIALGKGGTLETVIEGKTGIFFKEQTIDSLITAIKNFEKTYDQFDGKLIRNHAEKFSISVFKKRFQDFVEMKYRERDA